MLSLSYDSCIHKKDNCTVKVISVLYAFQDYSAGKSHSQEVLTYIYQTQPRDRVCAIIWPNYTITTFRGTNLRGAHAFP